MGSLRCAAELLELSGVVSRRHAAGGGHGAGSDLYFEDSGATFTSHLPNNSSYQGLAGATNGSVLVAIVFGGGIYRSTDFGSFWSQVPAPMANWIGVASSANGTNLVAAVLGSGIYTSTDSGLTWNLSGSHRNWSAITSSADGSKLAAAVNGGLIYLSTDFGVTWAPANVTSNLWSVLYSSADSNQLVALANHSGSAYLSTDGGATWNPKFINATPGSTNVFATDVFNMTVVCSNDTSQVVTTSSIQTNITTTNLTISVPQITITNVVGFSIPQVSNLSGTNKVNVTGFLGINLLGHKMFGPSVVGTNAPGTNALGIGASTSKGSASNIISGTLMAPATSGTTSKRLTNIFTATLSGIQVTVSNVVTRPGDRRQPVADLSGRPSRPRRTARICRRLLLGD